MRFVYTRSLTPTILKNVKNSGHARRKYWEKCCRRSRRINRALRHRYDALPYYHRYNTMFFSFLRESRCSSMVSQTETHVSITWSCTVRINRLLAVTLGENKSGSRYPMCWIYQWESMPVPFNGDICWILGWVLTEIIPG